MDADRERIEAAIHEAVRSADPYLTEIASHLIVAGGKRLRPVVAIAAAQVGGDAASRRRGARRRRLRARAPRLALPRRRDRRGRHPARRRDGQRQVGQPAGDPRRRLPAVAGVGDRRLARHRGRRPAGPHDRLAVRGRDRAAPPHLRRRPHRRTATSSSIQGKTASLYGTAARIGGIVAGLDRPTIDALTEWGNAFGMVFQIVDDILDVTATDRAARQAGRPRPGRGRLHAARCCARWRSDARRRRGAARRCSASRSTSAERDKALAIVRPTRASSRAVATARQYVAAAEAACDDLPPGAATDALRAAPAALLESRSPAR